MSLSRLAYNQVLWTFTTITKPYRQMWENQTTRSSKDKRGCLFGKMIRWYHGNFPCLVWVGKCKITVPKNFVVSTSQFLCKIWLPRENQERKKTHHCTVGWVDVRASYKKTSVILGAIFTKAPIKKTFWK